MFWEVHGSDTPLFSIFFCITICNLGFSQNEKSSVIGVPFRWQNSSIVKILVFEWCIIVKLTAPKCTGCGGGGRGEGRGERVGGEMTQTMYAHVNK
jgi:hypothetical protein